MATSKGVLQELDALRAILAQPMLEQPSPAHSRLSPEHITYQSSNEAIRGYLSSTSGSEVGVVALSSGAAF